MRLPHRCKLRLQFQPNYTILVPACPSSEAVRRLRDMSSTLSRLIDGHCPADDSMIPFRHVAWD